MTVSGLIENQTKIKSTEFGVGLFLKKQANLYFVKFGKHNEEKLLERDFEKTWFIHVEMDEQTELEYERIHFDNVENQIENRQKYIDNRLSELRYADNYELGTTGKSIAMERIDLQTKQSRLVDIRNRPFFARIDVNSDDRQSTYYIGEHAFEDAVVDWRDKRADPMRQPELYANEGILSLLREFVIFNRELKEFTDRLLKGEDGITATGDPRLIQIILHSRDANVKNIISSIQNNQFKIITADELANILVDGVAGSGKTMILTHRLSFWTFRTTNGMNIEDVFIISPTKMMNVEIANYTLDLNGSHMLTNHDFNLYLANYLLSEIDGQTNLTYDYLSNNMLSDDLVSKLYTKSHLDKLVNQLKMLIDKDNKEDVASLYVYLKEVLINQFQNISRKAISEKDYDQYHDIFEDMFGKLSPVSAGDILSYAEKIEARSREIVHVNDEYQKTQLDVDELSLQAKMMVKKAPLVTKDFKYLEKLSIPDMNKEYNVFLKEIKKDSSTVNKYRKIYQVFARNKSKLDKLYKKFEKEGKAINQLLNRDNDLTAEETKELATREEKYESLSKDIAALKEKQKDAYQLFNCGSDKEVEESMERFENHISAFEKNIEALEFIPRFYQEYDIKYKKFKEAEKAIKRFSATQIYEVRTIRPFVQVLKNNVALFDLKSTNPYDEKKVAKVIKVLMEQKVPRYQNNADFMVSYLKYRQNDLVKKIDNYLLTGQYLPIISLLVEYLVEKEKKEQKIDLENHYEFEVFHTLYLLASENNYTPINKKMIYIDEYQDYSFAELFTYKKLFSNSCFNYYGDINQSVNPKGLDQLGIDVLTRNFEKYYIKENYRNALDITTYVNRKLNLEMQPIGLPGSAKECSFDYARKLFKKGDVDAVIVSSAIKKKFMLKKHSRLFREEIFSFVSEDNQTISKDKINILTPREAKGLEFKRVVVVNDGMNDREKYVAYTRAIENLYVIEGVGL